MSAAVFWITSLVLIFLVLLLGGLLDLWLFLAQKQTITEWLTDHPAWFFVPAGLMVAFIVLLGIHLYME